jgi:hypothetical protein
MKGTDILCGSCFEFEEQLIVTTSNHTFLMHVISTDYYSFFIVSGLSHCWQKGIAT